MPSAEAHVQTERPNRYLVQLCRHFSHKGEHLRHRSGTQHSGFPPMPADQVRVEWSDTHGIVDFGWGKCTMKATPEVLMLRAEATDDGNLRRVQDIVTGHLDRFSRRDPLTVSWQPPGARTAPPHDATRTTPAPDRKTPSRRGHGSTIVLIMAGILAVAGHLGLGGAVLANLQWTSWVVDIILAVVLVKVIALGLFAFRRRQALNITRSWFGYRK